MGLRIIKIVSIVILTASAVVNLLFGLRDDKDNISDWGMLILVAIILSAVSAIITEVIEYKDKQKEDEISKAQIAQRDEMLQKIKSGITNSNSPLVPFRSMFTFKSPGDTKKIQKVSNHPKSKNAIIKTEYLQLVGSVKMGESPYNMENEEPKERHITISDREYLDELLKSRTLVIWPVIEVEIKPKQSEVNQSIKFKHPVDPFNISSNTVREVRVYDDIVYQDCLADRWNMKGINNYIFGIQDLLHSTVLVRAFYSKGEIYNFDLIPEFTNVIFYFGTSPTYILSFDAEQLKENQKTTVESENDSFFKFENDLAKEMFQRKIQVFEIEITDEIFNNQLRIYG